MTKRPPTKTLGQRIRELRTAAKLTQTELFKLSGVSQTYLSDLELDKCDPPASTLQKLARGLGVTVGELFAPL